MVLAGVVCFVPSTGINIYLLMEKHENTHENLVRKGGKYIDFTMNLHQSGTFHPKRRNAGPREKVVFLTRKC